MEKSFRKDVLEKCWSCGEGIDKDDNCFCDRQSLKIRDLSERIKVLEDALKEWKDERCEDPTRIEVVPTEYRAEWKLYDCGKCRACKARAALEVKP